MMLAKDSNESRRDPFSEAFKKFIVSDWASDDNPLPAALPASAYTPARRRALTAHFPGATLVIPAGPLKPRANDTDYRFRPHSAFAYYTGFGEDREPDATLLLRDDEATLYFRGRAPRTDREFYADTRYGEMWVGRRDSLEEVSAALCIDCQPLSALEDALREAESLLVVREADPAVTALVDAARGSDDDRDDELHRVISEARFVKDEFEIAQLRRACDATVASFEAVARELPQAVTAGRGERWVEGVFGLHARHLGNAVGYDTIAAGGDNANTLHWIRNNGDLRDGDLLLLDAGVEVDTLYTGDVTRTLPVSGRFSPQQRRVYEAVFEAQSAGIAACRSGAKFIDVHRAAVTVLAEFFADLGILPCSVEDTLADNGGFHRRWMVHGTSHHLGLDVHDCAHARAQEYRLGTLRAGMVITVEPGVYFKSTDLLVPEEYRGIGIRIEDDILITEGDPINLTAALPRAADDVEAWLAHHQRG